MLRLSFVSVRYADETMQSQHPPLSSVVQSTELPSLSTERHLVFPLKASFALQRGRRNELPSREGKRNHKSEINNLSRR